MKPNISPEELNWYIMSAPNLLGKPLPPAKQWSRIDVGQIETYVGDGVYVIAVVNKRPADAEEMKENGVKAQKLVVSYLMSEGFIDKDFLFIGLQTFDLGSELPS